MKPVLATLTGAVATAATCLAIFALVSPSGPSTGTAPATPTSTVSMKRAPSLAQLYARSQDAVAYVQTQKGSGSGFLVSKNGQIVTNEHVVDGARRVTVRFGEHGKALPARVVGQDATDDLAVLEVAPSAVSKITPLTLGSSSALRVGQSAIAIGSPFGLSGTLTSGVVSALGRDIQSPNGHTISGVVRPTRRSTPATRAARCSTRPAR